MTATVHRLGPDDVALVRRLNQLFGRAFDDPATYGAHPPDDAYLEGLLAKENILVLVALAGGEVLGGLVAYELDKFESRRKEVYLYDLAVDAAHRRKGIATALIRELSALAAQRGAWAVFVQADREDGPAISLYSKMGLKEEVLHFNLIPP